MDISKLQDLMQKEMSRKEFMQHLAVMALGATGIAAMISRMTTTNQTGAAEKGSSAYGARSYGR